MLSNYLAEIWGITIVAVSLALLIKERHLKRLFLSLETEDNLFSWGLISFVIGVATVLAHNVWVESWQVVVTVLGWIALLKGLFLLFMPEFMRSWAKKVENKAWLSVVLVLMVFAGLALTYFAFTA